MSFKSRARESRARASAIGLMVALVVATPSLAANYVQGPGSTLTFATKYQGEVFVGRFASFATRLSFDPEKLSMSKLDVTIALSGVSVGNSDGDATLESSDFFNVAKFPQARFSATRFRSLGGKRYAADGTLTLRGVSTPVTFNFTWAPGPRALLTGNATVRRLDFGVGGGDWADTDLIPNEIAVSTKVVLVPAK